MNVRNADIHKAVDRIRVRGDAQRYCRLVRGGTAPDVDDEPRIRDLNVPRRTLAIASAQNAAAEDPFVEIGRSIDVSDREKMCDGEPLVRGHVIVRRHESTVREGGALSDLDDIAVGVADVAANIAVLRDRLGDELGSTTFPQFV